MANIENLNVISEISSEPIQQSSEEVIEDIQVKQVLSSQIIDEDLPQVEINGQLWPARAWARDQKIKW